MSSTRGFGAVVSLELADAEERQLGPRRVRLFPIYHPAAALYTPAMLATLRADFERVPELLSLPALDQPEPEPELVVPEPELALVPADAEQLGLF